MSSDRLEDEVRRSLARWADGVRPAPPRTGVVARRVAVRRRLRVSRVLGVVLVVAGLFAVGVLRAERTTSVRTASSPPIADGRTTVFGDPALLVLDAPWRLTGATISLDGDGVGPHYSTDFTFGDGGRTIEVSAYTNGNNRLQGSHAIDVRHLTAQTGGIINGKMRVAWDEGGVHMRIDGWGFDHEVELIAELDAMRVVDDAGFIAAVPAGVGNDLLIGLRSYPLDSSGFVQWSFSSDVTCHEEGNADGHPVDPVTGC